MDVRGDNQKHFENMAGYIGENKKPGVHSSNSYLADKTVKTIFLQTTYASSNHIGFFPEQL